MKFYKRGDRDRKAQFFDKEKINVIKYGESINVYDMIQEANEDTEIYKTIEKYHGNEQKAIEAMEKDIPTIYEEMKSMDLRDMLKAQEQAKNMWNKLPREIRNQFNNSKEQFVKEGMQWLEAEKAKIEQKNKKAETIPVEPVKAKPAPAEPVKETK